ncbi:zinc-dependent metalloprotease [Pendulispora brunnea]|uniref:Zinc-dependent metalloprotease n=1 Tax=Pendulispora brunnea TaxID=2905690 RepID=A0ABZ2KEW9_9BACT
MKIRQISSVLSLLAALAGGCSSGDGASTPDVTQEELGWRGGNRIWISKSALGKEFLWQANLTDQPGLAAFGATRSRIVHFERQGDDLMMIEENDLHGRPTADKRLIVASFPIQEDNDSTLVFDFNAGTTKLFVASDWAYQDSDGPWYDAAEHFRALDITESYVERAQIHRDQLVISQIAQVEEPAEATIDYPAGHTFPTYLARYYIQPYRPNPNFVPRRWAGQERLGYFESQPRPSARSAESDLIYALKFDSSKPIVFAISANTPSEYKSAIADGVLYWNRAFGRNVVSVVDAPADVEAPDHDYNVIQWIPWDAATFAYADVQLDPRTGETLHGQVFFSSAFALDGSRNGLRALVRTLRAYERPAGPRVAFAGAGSSSLCTMTGTEFARRQADQLEALLTRNATDDTLKAMSMDYVRLIAAHEIGHVLGLRHNFAGSTGASYDMRDHEAHLAAYVANGGTVPHGVVSSSTVMDYLLIESGAMMGDIIEKKETALEYDRKAIAVLYDDELQDPGEIPHYCSDSNILEYDPVAPVYSDCQRFDQGKSALEFAVYARKKLFSTLPHRIIERYIANATRRGSTENLDPKPIEGVVLNPNEFARSAWEPYLRVRDMFVQGGRSLEVSETFASFPHLGELEQAASEKAETAWLESELQRVDGIEVAYEGTPPSFVEDMVRKLKALLADPEYLEGKGAGGMPYRFSPEDAAVIENKSRVLFAAMGDALLEWELYALAGVGPEGPVPLSVSAGLIRDDAPGKRFATMTAKVTRDVLLATSGQFIEADVPAPSGGGKVHVKLPIFKYSYERRLQAARVLADAKGVSPSYLVKEKSAIRREFEKLQMAALGGHAPADFESMYEELPDGVIAWLSEQSALRL